MKIVRTFRIDENFFNEVKKLAEKQGITFSQFVELACYEMAGEVPKPSKQFEKQKRCESINLKFRVDIPVYKKLAKIVQKKNSTLSQEIYFRLAASLDNPVFSDVELGKFWETKCNIDRLGNLLKLAIDQKTPVNDMLFMDLQKQLTSLRNEFNAVLTTINQRVFIK